MYPPGVEPWEPNLSAFLGARRDAIKWKDLILPSTPVPTREGAVQGDVVGLFEGAGYKARGLYRPQEDCKMFHKGLVGFCKVCRRAIERVGPTRPSIEQMVQEVIGVGANQALRRRRRREPASQNPP